jgi:hypothetical protein
MLFWHRGQPDASRSTPFLIRHILSSRLSRDAIFVSTREILFSSANVPGTGRGHERLEDALRAEAGRFWG